MKPFFIERTVLPLMLSLTVCALLPLLGHGQEVEAHQSREHEEEDDAHKGFFSRFELGLGYAWIFGGGVMPPAPGLSRIENPFHHTPTLSLSADFGGSIVPNLSLHAGFLVEKPILRYHGREKMAFNLLGLGIGVSYYFTPYDLFLTGRFRVVGMFIFLPDVACEKYFKDKYEVYGGPGLSITLGKEWFGNDDGGVGIGLQMNYYHIIHSSIDFDYLSLLFVLTVTGF